MPFGPTQVAVTDDPGQPRLAGVLDRVQVDVVPDHVTERRAGRDDGVRLLVVLGDDVVVGRRVDVGRGRRRQFGGRGQRAGVITRATSVRVWTSPFAIGPMFHRPVPESYVPTDGVALTNTSPEGSWSTTITPVVLVGPPFVTVTTKVAWSPT